MTRWLGALLILLCGATAAPAQCRLALALAMDVSASVDASDYILQRDGLARALDAPDIREAILRDPAAPVAVAVYEWSGRNQNVIVLDWTMIDSPAALDRVIATIAGTRRSWKDFPTALGYALGYGAGLLRRSPECERKVIDVSGDGTNNEGFAPEKAYAHFPFDGITVNGLVISGQEEGVVAFYRDEVLRGPDAFLEIARGFEEFENAMARKLFREVNGLVVGSREADPWQPG